MNYEATLDRSFLALSHPVRRAIVERLTSGPATVGQASAGLGVTKPAVTKHVKVLEGAGVVRRSVTGREHVLQIDPDALRDVFDWLELHRSLWERKLAVVEEFLAESDEKEVRE